MCDKTLFTTMNIRYNIYEASDSVENNTNNENNNAYHNNNEDVNNENNNENNNLENNNEDNNNTYKVKDRRWLPKRQFRKMNKEN